MDSDLPSALDNRPLKFDEYIEKVPQFLFVSATPSEFELKTLLPYRTDNKTYRTVRPQN